MRMIKPANCFPYTRCNFRTIFDAESCSPSRPADNLQTRPFEHGREDVGDFSSGTEANASNSMANLNPIVIKTVFA